MLQDQQVWGWSRDSSGLFYVLLGQARSSSLEGLQWLKARSWSHSTQAESGPILLLWLSQFTNSPGKQDPSCLRSRGSLMDLCTGDCRAISNSKVKQVQKGIVMTPDHRAGPN